MSFNAYKPFTKKRNLFPKFTIVFLLGISFALLFSNAFPIVTGIENATQYIKEIILTNDGRIDGSLWVTIDWSTSWGRIWSDLYCTKGFDKCINIKWLLSTWDIVGFLTGRDLNIFKTAEIDPLSWNIISLLWRATSIEWLMRAATWNIASLLLRADALETFRWTALTDISNLLWRATSIEWLMRTATWNIANLSWRADALETFRWTASTDISDLLWRATSIEWLMRTATWNIANLEAARTSLTTDLQTTSWTANLVYNALNALLVNMTNASQDWNTLMTDLLVGVDLTRN